MDLFAKTDTNSDGSSSSNGGDSGGGSAGSRLFNKFSTKPTTAKTGIRYHQLGTKNVPSKLSSNSYKLTQSPNYHHHQYERLAYEDDDASTPNDDDDDDYTDSSDDLMQQTLPTSAQQLQHVRPQIVVSERQPLLTAAATALPASGQYHHSPYPYTSQNYPIATNAVNIASSSSSSFASASYATFNNYGSGGGGNNGCGNTDEQNIASAFDASYPVATASYPSNALSQHNYHRGGQTGDHRQQQHHQQQPLYPSLSIHLGNINRFSYEDSGFIAGASSSDGGGAVVGSTGGHARYGAASLGSRIPLGYGDGGHDNFIKNFRSINDKKMKKSPTLETEKSSRTTNMQTLMHILKGNIGTGILAMPNAFMNAGLFTGLLTLPIFAILCAHCMHILVHANRVLNRRLNIGMLEYQDVAANSLVIGPKCLRGYSQWFSRLVNVFLLITQFGFCCVYALFVAENLSKFLSEISSNSIYFTPTTYLAMLLPFFILLTFVKSLRSLSIFSSLANLLQTIGLIIVMINLIENIGSTGTGASSSALDIDHWGSIQTFPLYMGTAIYAFEGIGLVLPLQKEMRNPGALGGKVGVLNTAMTIVACLNIAIGFYGYLKFGSYVEGSITLNMPNEPLYQYCKLIFALAIFLSYAIQYYVPFNIIWPYMMNQFELKQRFGARTRTVMEYTLRASLVIMTIALAALVPQLDLFISLVGALSSSCLALIFPPLIDICVRWEENKGFTKWTWLFGKNIFIFLVGIFGFTFGSYASIENIVANFKQQ